MDLFYIRVSSKEQNEARQVKAAEELGIAPNQIYIDKQSGKDTNREQLKELLKFARVGDTIYTESISRIARNTRDLLNIVEDLTSRGIDFVSLKESIDTRTPQGKFMLTVFGAMATLERENMLQRQSEGIAIAKAEGKYKGRAPKQVDKLLFKQMCEEWRRNERTAVSIQKHFGITSTTFYRWVKEYEI